MWTKLKDGVSVKDMINILNCDIKQISIIDDAELDEQVTFNGFYGAEYTCTLRDMLYTYKFCKKLLEMCADAGYIK